MKYRVLRSGSHDYSTRDLRTSRPGGEPEFRFRYVGFRIIVRRRAP